MWCNTCNDFHRKDEHTWMEREERQAKSDVLTRLYEIEKRLDEIEEKNKNDKKL